MLRRFRPNVSVFQSRSEKGSVTSGLGSASSVHSHLPSSVLSRRAASARDGTGGGRAGTVGWWAPARKEQMRRDA